MTDAEKIAHLEAQLKFLRKSVEDHLFYTSKLNREEAATITAGLFTRAEVWSKP